MVKSSKCPWWNKHKRKCYIILAFISAIFIFFAILYIFKNWLSLDLMPSPCPNANDEINAWLYFLSGAGTAILAVIAYWQIGDMNRQNRTDFLFRIDERWGNPEAIKARTIIHELYLQVQKENQNILTILEHATDTREAYIQLKIGEKIIEYAKEKKRKDEFIHLLNFLDFMETIGYIESENHVTVNELDALCGESLMFNYKIFKPYIEDKRERHKKKDFYAHFDNLYKKLKEKSTSEAE